MKIEIKSRFTGSVLFALERDNNSFKLTLEAAVKTDANLYGANLYDANLYGANLYGANLYDADLRGANLYDANLRDADLRGADLRGADLYGANLYDADLRGANLRGSDLRGADLYDANLYDADLRGANLRGSDLRGADLYDADGEKWRCDGDYHHITNIGSESGTLELYSCGDKGWLVNRGCFTGSKQEFLDAVQETHGDNEHGQKYRAIIEVFCGESE